MIYNFVFIHFAVRMKTWCNFCPVRVRYLIIAAYLSGVNPKETDNLKFVAGRDERRKKQRIGTDNDPNFADKGSKAAAAAASALGRKVAFSLERLISIYAQVVTSVTQHTAHGCGDVAIYATVSSDKS